jgi:cytochrome c-type biogenesis protein CcmE
MKPKSFRLILVLCSVFFLSLAVLLVLQGMKQGIVYFYSPSDVLLAEKNKKIIAEQKTIRIGGLVAKGSVKSQGTTHHFSITDKHKTIDVIYQGLLPSLFREEQGVIADGVLDTHNVLNAQSILAKHDENYMPKEVYKALRESAEHKALGE